MDMGGMEGVVKQRTEAVSVVCGDGGGGVYC